MIILVLTGLILISGFWLRAYSILNTETEVFLRADDIDYYSYAFNLKYNKTFSKDLRTINGINCIVKPDSSRTPGYPLLIIPFIGRYIPDSINRIRFFQLMISFATLYLTFLFCNCYFSKPLTLFASFLTAFSPHLIICNSHILSETSYCFFLVLLCFYFTRFISNPSAIHAFVTGILAGASSLIRPGFQYIPLFMIFFMLIHYGKKKGCIYAVMILAGFGFIFSPWMIRNAITLDGPPDNILKINFLHH